MLKTGLGLTYTTFLLGIWCIISIPLACSSFFLSLFLSLEAFLSCAFTVNYDDQPPIAVGNATIFGIFQWTLVKSGNSEHQIRLNILPYLFLLLSVTLFYHCHITDLYQCYTVLLFACYKSAGNDRNSPDNNPSQHVTLQTLLSHLCLLIKGVFVSRGSG